jgi:hypothetical protein
MQRRIRLPPNSSTHGPFLCGLTPEQLQRISDEFGPLSEIGRKRLQLGVIYAVQNKWFDKFGRPAAASQLADGFRLIEDRANELLNLLDARFGRDTTEDKWRELAPKLAHDLGRHLAQVLIEEGAANPVLTDILSVVPAEGGVVGGVPREEGQLPIGVTTGGSLNLVKMTITMVAEAASRARAEASAAVSPGRGGARRGGRTSSSRFALDLIRLYVEMRRRYPRSGSAVGYSRGGPLSRFVLAVFAATIENDPELKLIRDATVGELFYTVRKSKGPEH